MSSGKSKYQLSIIPVMLSWDQTNSSRYETRVRYHMATPHGRLMTYSNIAGILGCMYIPGTSSLFSHLSVPCQVWLLNEPSLNYTTSIFVDRYPSHGAGQGSPWPIEATLLPPIGFAVHVETHRFSLFAYVRKVLTWLDSAMNDRLHWQITSFACRIYKCKLL